MIPYIVLRCANPENSRKFYETLGVSFSEEKHGNGPSHFAGSIRDELILELYPLRKDKLASRVTIGIPIASPEKIRYAEHASGQVARKLGDFYVLQDPDGNEIHLQA